MDDKIRKNYTLYLILCRNEVEILKGTLKEIDDFTTCFENSQAMLKRLLPNKNISKYSYSFVIKSSKDKIYNVIYYPYRPILFDSNINSIMSKLKEVDKKILIKFLKEHTNVHEYNGVPNASSIPVVKFYRSLLGDNYYADFDNYVKSNYNALRNIVINVLQESDLACLYKDIHSSKKNEIATFCKNISDEIYYIYSSITEKRYEDDDLDEEPIRESIEEKAYDILNNQMISDDEKIEELGILFDNNYEMFNSYVYKLRSNN